MNDLGQKGDDGLLSMTGYGSGEYDNGQLKIMVEAKAVNNRYSEYVIKQPRNYMALEDKIKKYVGMFIERGHVEIYIRVQYMESESQLHIDQEQATVYHDELRTLCRLLGEEYVFDGYRLLSLPQVVIEEKAEEDLQAVWLVMEKALEKAMKQHMAMRKQEGAAIEADLQEKLTSLHNLHHDIETRAPQVIIQYQQRLHERMNELLNGVEIEQERLWQEIAIMAEKSCIDEELVRLNSHLGQFAQTMAEQGAVGRKLDFLIQEMNRETNTIGSKANDLQIGQLVVAMKSQLEKIREQIQNIE